MKKAFVEEKECVACGTCLVTCPRQAIHIAHGCYAVIDSVRCVGCGLCSKACPASVIECIHEKEKVRLFMDCIPAVFVSRFVSYSVCLAGTHLFSGTAAAGCWKRRKELL